MDVVGSVRVSTTEQADSGAGLIAQRVALADEAARRGWILVEVFEDAGVSGKSMAGRVGLAAALEAVASGAAEALVVAKLDRLSRSLLDFAGLMERSRSEGWSLVALDLGVDTTTPSGEMLASVLVSFAQFERRLIGQRTREALAIKRQQGVRLGRPPSLPTDIRARVRAEREDGATYQQIADGLNSEGVSTAHGGRQWYPATVRGVVTSAA